MALEKLSLDVSAGEFVAVLGASGCGKSTLLRLVAGLEEPTDGMIRVLERAPREARKLRSFGIVFQDPALLPWRTVLQNIALPLDIFGGEQKQTSKARVEEWTRRVGLTGFEKALPAQLSGGMRSRVAIARALVFRPPILLMDEPFGALDELTRREMQRELLNLWESYRPSVLFITHSVSEALLLADRVVVMASRPGRISAVLDVPLGRPRTTAQCQTAEFARGSEMLLGMLAEGEIRTDD